jgi:sporulation protein YlmC with PRC-barrel domain
MEWNLRRELRGVISLLELYMVTSNNLTSDVISSEKVEGTAVYNVAGEKLGSIDDLMIDKVSGQVRYAVLEFGGFLGMGTDRYPIPWKVLKYSTDKQGYVVPLDKARLEKAPKYSEGKAPVYDNEYGTRVNSYYDRY